MGGKKEQARGAGHRQRLRDKFLERGIEAFADDELIELLLSFGTPRSDTKQPAREALARFGSLDAVLDASADALRQVKGIGPKNVFALHFIQGVARRYLRQRITGRDYLHNSQQVADYLVHLMRGLEREVLMVVFLDAGHAVIDSSILSEGTATVNTVYPREVIRAALERNASALVIAHNHPSGRLEPSPQDRDLTRTLYLACTFVQIRLLDHLIIGQGERPYSFADHGLMREIGRECDRLLATR